MASTVSFLSTLLTPGQGLLWVLSLRKLFRCSSCGEWNALIKMYIRQWRVYVRGGFNFRSGCKTLVYKVVHTTASRCLMRVIIFQRRRLIIWNTKINKVKLHHNAFYPICLTSAKCDLKNAKNNVSCFGFN